MDEAAAAAASVPPPLSASLLNDWMELSHLNPDDMEALQQELELGSDAVFTRERLD